MKWIRIDNEDFNVKDISVQYNITEHAIPWRGSVNYARGSQSCDISIMFDFTDSQKVFKIFDQRVKFDITSYELVAKGCYIKSIDADQFNNVVVADITADYVTLKDIIDIRDEKINQILNKTSDEEDNIN